MQSFSTFGINKIGLAEQVGLMRDNSPMEQSAVFWTRAHMQVPVES
jgi:hypothetical protein